MESPVPQSGKSDEEDDTVVEDVLSTDNEAPDSAHRQVPALFYVSCVSRWFSP